MPLMGVPDGASFSVGSSNGAADQGKTLDEMIEDRRKDQNKASKRAPKGASNADRSIATGRAKRAAATKARRGLTQENKPNAMEVEREVYRQSRKTNAAKKKSQKKATGGRIAPDSTLRNKKKKERNKSTPVAIFGGRAPPKKAIEAAVKGMEAAGYKIPQNHQMVMTFVPTSVAPAPAKKEEKGKKGGNQKPASKAGRGGDGGRGGGRRRN